MPLDRRLAGVLLHPSSLPGPFGIGDFGSAAHAFLDWMKDAGLGYWQVLPLGPTSFGDSPYQCFSASAGNPILISPELLVREGLLRESEIAPPGLPQDHVDYGPVINWKAQILGVAAERFAAGEFPKLRKRYTEWLKTEEVTWWLEEFALFMALKHAHNGASWDTWDAAYRERKTKALNDFKKKHAAQIERYRFEQFLFAEQWDTVRRAAFQRGIEIIGDIPIYVAYDSADTWANQSLFQLNPKTGLPTHVAGVPPDYFSKTGQLWGNPLYRWDVLAKTKYEWWVKRIRCALTQCSIIRFDHFRGFMGYWSVPFGNPTAEHGEWIKGPGAKFFTAMQAALGELPLIAEDLGEITTDVVDVRLKFGLPGMKILQFAWGAASIDPLIPNPNSGFLPHQIDQNQVVYTGTHDNDTTIGWWKSTSEVERHVMRSYLSTDGGAPHWDLIRCAFHSLANTAVIPMQDFLGLGPETRMNLPGAASGNWSWRMHARHMDPVLAKRIRSYALLYGRAANAPEVAKAKPHKKPTY